VNRKFEVASVPGLERVRGRGEVEVPGAKVVEESGLVLPEEGDVEM
jgi:hypothetical protein